MRKRLQLLLLTILLCLSVNALPVARAADYTDLRRMLERVPDTAPIREQLISYLDLSALIDSRQGAAHPRSIADWNALDQASDAAGLYRAVQFGLSAGVPEILQNLRNFDDMLTATGVDIFSVDRMLTANQPPSTLNVLDGKFDPAAVKAAYQQRGYQSTTNGDFTVLCPPAGCDTGMKLDLKSRDPANPFGGRLGRLEPIAVNSSYLLNSPDNTILDAALAATPTTSLAANADYLSAANTAGKVGTVLQAYFVPAPLVSDFTAYIPPAVTEQEKQIRDRLMKDVKPIPQYSLALMAHVARADDQAVLVSLVYTNEADAKAAAEELPARLNAYQSVRVKQAFMSLITERGGKLESTEVVADTETGKFVVIMQIAAPSESAEKTDGNYVASGLLFRLFYSSLVSRDTAWLITQVPQ